MSNLLTRGLGIVGRLGLLGGGQILSGSTHPLSGTSGTPLGCPAGSLYINSSSGAVYVNEGTKTSPYWTPVQYDQPGLRAWHSDWRDGVGEPLADTDASLLLASGVRIHGQGIADTDSGGVVTYTAELGSIMRLTTTNEDAHTIGLTAGGGDTVELMQPDTHGPLVIDCEFTHVSAITLRATFMGFIGAIADTLDPVVTGATVTLTLVLDDLAGMFQDVGLTDGDGVFAPHNKSDEAATLATTDTGVDLSTTIAAAATYQRWRVEISRAGVMTCFVDKAQVGRIVAALDVDEEVAPSFYVESTSTAVKSVDVKRFATWGLRA